MIKSRVVTWKALHQVAEGATTADVRPGHAGERGSEVDQEQHPKPFSLLSAIYNYALRKQWVDANPCVGVEKPGDNCRQRYLTADEYRNGSARGYLRPSASA